MGAPRHKRTSAANPKEKMAMDLYIQGLTYTEIAKRMGYATASGAQNLVNRHLARSVPEATEKVREMELARLDELWKANQRLAKYGDPKAIAAALQIMDRRAKYLGLDQAIRVEIPQLTNTGLAQAIKAPEGVALLAQAEAFMAGAAMKSEMEEDADA